VALEDSDTMNSPTRPTRTMLRRDNATSTSNVPAPLGGRGPLRIGHLHERLMTSSSVVS
jgi:hypothetical protein